jgi:hypothetical protein
LRNAQKRCAEQAWKTVDSITIQPTNGAFCVIAGKSDWKKQSAVAMNHRAFGFPDT